MARRPQRQPVGSVESAAMVVAAICCMPCICVCGAGLLVAKMFHAAATYERPSVRRKREEQLQDESRQRTVRIQAPKVLGPRLQGSLTIGRRVEIEHDELNHHVAPPAPTLKKTGEQLQSPLFRLPLEVRRQIYEEVIGGYVIHIYSLQAYKRMGHVRCKTPDIIGCTCRTRYKQKGVPDCDGNIDLLAPLKTCRRVYSEAIEILYKCNTFDFDYLGNVLMLSLTILPERMELISDVQWQYYYEYGMLQSIATIKNEGRIPTPILATARPWYNCYAPEKCPCLRCWTKFYFNDLVNHKFVIYDWIMPARDHSLRRRRGSEQ